MTTHYDNSGSEDGQLRSPGDDQFISGDDELDEHDGDSLDIKPPQASTHYSRDAAAREPKRRDKLNKEKKHSKERRQHRDKSSAIGSSGGGSDGGHERERERKAAGAAFREGRTEIDRYQQRGGGGGGVYERNDGGRYQKHYDRNRDNHALLLHHNQQPAPIHMHRRQQDYYERPNEYHHHHGNDYHAMRQVYNNKHYNQRVDYGHDISEPVTSSNIQRDREREREKERERRKYSNSDGQQDAESLEQDLRSRLLSKRHKYVKDYEPATRKHHIELQAAQVYEEKERNERSHEEARKERHLKSRRGKESRTKVVIEVFDSPDVTDLTYEKTTTQLQQHSKKHKRRDKDTKLPEAPTVDISVVEKQRSPEDIEVVSRRSKLLVAEREKTKRKEQAREELEARREKRREHGAADIIDELSPTAVAATVTAGLSALVKRNKSGTTEKRKKQSKKHKSKQHSEYEEGEHEEQHDEVKDDGKDNEYDDSETDEQSEAESEHNVKMGKRRKNSLETLQHVKRKKLKSSKHQIDEQLTDDEDVDIAEESANSNSDSDAASERSYKKSKAKRKHSKKSSDQDKKHRSKKQAAQAEDDDDVDEALKLPDSPLSIGELSKSPNKRRGRRKNLADDENDDDDADDDERTQSTRSHSHTRSHTESRSRSQTPHSSSHSSSHSRSRSRSRSLSHRRRRTISSSRSDSRSRSRSARSRSSRSRSRTEERDMHANLRKSDAAEQQQHHLTDAEKRKTASSPTPCDDKGVPLPNYFPGLQGCRSVEEFQCLNRIEEGTYGVVYRAKDKRTHEIVALKRLKMEKEKEGFPITSLREINTLLKGQHPNIVTVREIVVGSNMDKIFIVMDYVEHDLKSLMETMKTRKQCFLPGEVKCLTQQLLSAVGHLHDNWILHRDLKTSNLLLSHKGILKVGDFGLAREYGSPLKKYTSLVVTLWYRAPELLLCSPEYSTPIDIWSVGCIFAEFLQMAPLFPGKSEIDELNRIFKELGTPNDKIWPGYKDLPAVKNLLSQNSQFADYPVSNLRKRFHEKASDTGVALLHGLLTYDPKQRLTADAALKHAYFKELPLPIDPSMFPTWPAKSELGARRALASSPKPPSGGSQFKQLGRDEPISNTSTANKSNSSAGFSGIITGNKKTTANTGFVLNAGMEQRQVAMGPGFNLKF